MEGKPINIPYLMMRRMEGCARRKSPLPYAAFVAKILRAFDISPFFNTREEAIIIDSNSLLLMNFSFAQNQWVRLSENVTVKRPRERREAGGNDDDEADIEEFLGTVRDHKDYGYEDAPEGPPLSDPFGDRDRTVNQLLANTSQMLFMMGGMRNDIGELQAQMESMNARLSSTESSSASQMQEMNERISSLEANQASQTRALNDRLRQLQGMGNEP